MCKRNSLLSSTIVTITYSTKSVHVSQAFESVGEIQLPKYLGLNQLAKRTAKKGAMLPTKLAVDLKNDAENKYLLNA